MAVAGSSRKPAQDSPSRQLLWELNRLVLSEQEEFYGRLDRESQQREAAHKSALAEAIARHDKVRNDAEAERDRHEKQQQQERAQREEQQRQEAERERQAKLEQERTERRRLAERAEAAARAERAATQEREAEEARVKAEKHRRDARAVQEKKEEQEAAERKRVLDKRKAKEATLAAAAAPSAPTSKTIQPNTSQSTARISQKPTPDPGREAEHQRYLGIHQTLKELRKFMTQQAKQNPILKEKMGDMRRELRKSVGQLREGKGKNTAQNNAIMNVLREALKSFPEPKVSLAKFVARPIEDVQAPALVIYLLNHLSKAIISQLIKEASVSPRLAEPIGVAAVNFFAREDFRVNGVSLIDILIAKYHVVCPPLFGIYGSESTDQGRERLGWWREEAGGPWISEQLHQDRMTGLGAGYAAISLRTFENSKMTNPYPPYNFWRALATILNVPAGQVTDTHFVLVRALIENSEQRFLMFFGDTAKQLMRFAIMEYPKRASRDSVAAKVLSNLGNTMKKDKKLYL
ncbi:MAG: hypothetical protein Q9186_003182 [Xanthomendoza sp. 1 TL-2023]